MPFIKSSFHQKNSLQSLCPTVNMIGMTETHMLGILMTSLKDQLFFIVLQDGRLLFVQKSNLG